MQVKLVSQFRCDGATASFWEDAIKGSLSRDQLEVLKQQRCSVDSVDPRRCLILVALKSRQMFYHNELLIGQKRLHDATADSDMPATVLLGDDDAQCPLVTYGNVTAWCINDAKDRELVEETCMPLWPELKLRK